MLRKKNLIYTCYALLPVVSVIFILAVSWLLVAAVEIYTNNLTMFNTLNRFSNVAEYNKMLPKPPFPGKELNNMFWFVQVSDIHISKFRSYGQVEDFKTLCSKWLPIINPSLVLITGDLTDAKDVTKIGSMQYKEEWLEYTSVIKQCKTLSTHWLDIRGNHDTFSVPEHDHPNNMYKQYGITKNQYKDGVHTYFFNTSYGKYVFNGIDLAPDPGPGRPFNFFGVPRQKTLAMVKKVASRRKFNGTVWYGHYPLSTTTNPHLLRRLLSLSGVAYLCGHLHTLLNAFPQMHAVHSEGLLELEIGDWKESRKFRIGVFDHDVFSFSDVIFSSNPIVVFTNPIDARYIIADKIPFTKSWNSTHIRFLVFHIFPITSATVSIDNKIICTNTEVVENVLHLCKWNPSLYMQGIHEISVVLKAEDGSSSSKDISFALDGTRPPLSLASIILLLTDFCTMLHMIFIISIFLTIVLPLLVKRYSQYHYIGLTRNLVRCILPQILSFLDCNEVYWPLFWYNCYICIGPFSIGYFVSEQIGVAFSLGIYSGGHFIEGSLTFLYVSVHLLLFNGIIFLSIGEMLRSPSCGKGPIRRLFFKFLFLFLICYEMYNVFMYAIAYGMMSSVLNSLTTWAILLMFYLYYQASKVVNVS